MPGMCIPARVAGNIGPPIDATARSEIRDGIRSAVTEPAVRTVLLVNALTFVTIGALLWTRVPGNPIGPLFLAAGSILVTATVGGVYADVGIAQTPPWPVSAAARALSNVLFFYPLVIVLVGIPLVFPDGRLPSPRFRWIVASAIVGMVSWTLLEAHVWSLDVLVLASTTLALIGAVTAVSLRFQRGDRAQRQQVKWLAADAAAATIVFAVAVTMPDPASAPFPALAIAVWVLALLTLLAMPIVIGIAILRYRLYEIDRIVSRTIAYVLVTGLLIAVFAGGILLFETVLAPFTDRQTIPVAASTLAVFALFQPVMRRVRRRVDRRFDRARYDGERMTAAFAERLRSETNVATVTGDLAGTTRSAVSPTSLHIWLRPRRNDSRTTS